MNCCRWAARMQGRCNVRRGYKTVTMRYPHSLRITPSPNAYIRMIYMQRDFVGGVVGKMNQRKNGERRTI